jgi:HlyD family secretion protein
MKKTFGITIAAAILVLIGIVGRATLQSLRKPTAAIPTVSVARGDVAIQVYTSGGLAASRSALLLAPAVSGGNLRMVRLLNTGASVKAGDIVVAFDPTEQEYKLEEARTDLERAQQGIIKARADAAVQAATDQTQLLSDRFNVRRAELTVGTNALVSPIDAKKNLLTLDEAKRVLAQLQSDIQSHTVSDQATLAVNEQKRQKALLGMQQAKRNIESMMVRSPIAGLVEVKQNEMAYGGILISGMPFPEFHVGDSTYPGTPVAEVIDPAEIDIEARIGQSDRANIKVGQRAVITADALPGKTFHGEVKTISSVASRSGFFFQAGTAPTFDLTIRLDRTDPSLRPGFKAHMIISGNPLQNVLYLPPQAIFEQNGNSVVYAKDGNGFRVRPVKILYRTETRAVITGLPRATLVALVNPAHPRAARQIAPGPRGPTLQGGGR